MPRRVLIQDEHGTSELVEVDAPDEESLREIMRLNPGLIPLDDIGLDMPMLVVGRETQLASGRIDLLGVCRTGDVVIAEFKTGTQNSDFRSVLSQLIDYGSDLWQMPVNTFDEGVVQRWFDDARADGRFRSMSLRQAASEYWSLGEMELEALSQRLEKVLQDGAFHYVVVAQNFRDSVVTSAEYLNASMRTARFHLVELSRFGGRTDTTAHAARALPVSGSVGRGRQSTQAVTTDEATFLESLSDDAQRDATREFFASLKSLGIRFAWGSRGTSLRIDTPDRAEPISIGWAFPEGASWLGVKHLSLGYDEATAASVPSVRDDLLAYLERIRAIPGGTEIAAKNVVGRTFRPSEVPGVVTSATAAISQLREAVNDR